MRTGTLPAVVATALALGACGGGGAGDGGIEGDGVTGPAQIAPDGRFWIERILDRGEPASTPPGTGRARRELSGHVVFVTNAPAFETRRHDAVVQFEEPYACASLTGAVDYELVFPDGRRDDLSRGAISCAGTSSDLVFVRLPGGTLQSFPGEVLGFDVTFPVDTLPDLPGGETRVGRLSFTFMVRNLIEPVTGIIGRPRITNVEPSRDAPGWSDPVALDERADYAAADPAGLARGPRRSLPTTSSDSPAPAGRSSAPSTTPASVRHRSSTPGSSRGRRTSARASLSRVPISSRPPTASRSSSSRRRPRSA